MDGERLPIRPEHHHLQSARSVVLLTRLVCHFASLLQVDGICGSAPNHVLPVHEHTFADLLTLSINCHNEAKALVGVPLLDPTLMPQLLLTHHFQWLGVWARCLVRNGLLDHGQLVVLNRRVSTLVKLDKLGGLDGLPHLLRLLHLLDNRVLVVLNLAEGLGVTLLLHVVNLGLDVQVQAGLWVVLPLARLLVDIPAAAIR
mmetsp:Transcript_42620/g.118677  ORF Transcript_42620/g.118677 Transcript_42620/m.118677 type:complete len:201 (-) Transcript_42620:401-1003(-)